jgi:thioredoxin-like negative regulator of GroEL
VYAQEDAASADAKALHLETFLDGRVRKAGRALLAVKVDRAAKADLATALGVKATPSIVVLRKDGTEAARFEGAIKPGPLAKALEAVAKR